MVCFATLLLGFIAGWGIHPMDIAAWGGGDLLNGPVEVDGRGTFHAEGICDTATAWNVNMKFGSGVTLRFEGAPTHPYPDMPACDIWEHEQEWKSATAASPTTAPRSKALRAGSTLTAAESTSNPRTLSMSTKTPSSPAHPEPRPCPQLPRLRQEPRPNRLPHRRLRPVRHPLSPQQYCDTAESQGGVGSEEGTVYRGRGSEPAVATAAGAGDMGIAARRRISRTEANEGNEDLRTLDWGAMPTKRERALSDELSRCAD